MPLDPFEAQREALGAGELPETLLQTAHRRHRGQRRPGRRRGERALAVRADQHAGGRRPDPAREVDAGIDGRQLCRA